MSTLTADKDALAGAAEPAPRNRGRDRGPRRPLWKTGLLIAAVIATIGVLSRAAVLAVLLLASPTCTSTLAAGSQSSLRELTGPGTAPSTASSSTPSHTGGTLLELTLAILCAYAFVFVEFRFKKIVFVLIIGSMMLPGHVTLIVNYITVANLGWLNSYAGIILPGVASAFAMFLLFQYMRTIDKDILQAAEIDGPATSAACSRSRCRCRAR